ncbi:MAG: Hpt domain-containing protein, partial [Bdellovibrionales bacterium]|nr:Hpt domain-containing protein [Bdellovibrionales bacterium]
SPEKIVDQIHKFISDVQVFLEDPSKSQALQNSEVSTDSGWGNDLSSQADPELIQEFIEKHVSLMDELEARLLEAIQLQQLGNATSPEQQEIHRFVKGYLHNIKGDAGSVGLVGVEKVTHRLEDLLGASSVVELVDLLLEYRSWVLDVCSAWIEKRTPKILSEKFIASWRQGERVAANIASLCKEPQDVSTEACSSKKSDRAPYKLSGDFDILSEFIAEAQDH